MNTRDDQGAESAITRRSSVVVGAPPWAGRRAGNPHVRRMLVAILAVLAVLTTTSAAAASRPTHRGAGGEARLTGQRATPGFATTAEEVRGRSGAINPPPP
jgi:hypothetical protein